LLVTKKRVLLLLNNKISHPNHGTDCGEAVLNAYRLPLTEQRPTTNHHCK